MPFAFAFWYADYAAFAIATPHYFHYYVSLLSPLSLLPIRQIYFHYYCRVFFIFIFSLIISPLFAVFIISRHFRHTIFFFASFDDTFIHWFSHSPFSPMLDDAIAWLAIFAFIDIWFLSYFLRYCLFHFIFRYYFRFSLPFSRFFIYFFFLALFYTSIIMPLFFAIAFAFSLALSLSNSFHFRRFRHYAFILLLILPAIVFFRFLFACRRYYFALLDRHYFDFRAARFSTPFRFRFRHCRLFRFSFSFDILMIAHIAAWWYFSHSSLSLPPPFRYDWCRWCYFSAMITLYATPLIFAAIFPRRRDYAYIDFLFSLLPLYYCWLRHYFACWVIAIITLSFRFRFRHFHWYCWLFSPLFAY